MRDASRTCRWRLIKSAAAAIGVAVATTAAASTTTAAAAAKQLQVVAEMDGGGDGDGWRRARVQEPRARLLPFALRAPQLPLDHSVDLAALPAAPAPPPWSSRVEWGLQWSHKRSGCLSWVA